MDEMTSGRAASPGETDDADSHHLVGRGLSEAYWLAQKDVVSFNSIVPPGVLKELRLDVSSGWFAETAKIAEMVARLPDLTPSWLDGVGNFAAGLPVSFATAPWMSDAASFASVMPAVSFDAQSLGIPSWFESSVSLAASASVFSSSLQRLFKTPPWLDNVAKNLISPLNVGWLTGSLGFDIEALRRDIERGHLPPNWFDVTSDVTDIAEDVEKILMEGVPLGYVPSARVIELLVDAPDAAARRRILSNNYRDILNDCEQILAELPAPRTALFYADTIRQAVRVFRDGNAAAAQALATNVLDTVLTQHANAAFGVGSPALKNHSYRVNLTKGGWRVKLSLYQVATIMNGRFTLRDSGSGYRRNATAHSVSPQHYTRVNALLAVMNATAVLSCFARDTEAFDGSSRSLSTPS